MCDLNPKLLSTIEVARAMAVGESSVKRWIDAGTLKATRTPGGHRRVAVPDLYSFLRETGRELADPEALGLAASGEARSPLEVCRTSLSTGDAATLASALAMLRLSQVTSAAMLDAVVYPAFRAVREACRHPSEECLVLHRAMAMLQTTLRAALSPDDASAVPLGPRIVLADIGYEVDGIPTFFAEAAVWDRALCLQLGANVPATVVEGASRTFEADLVWISASGPASPRAVKAEYERIATRAKEAGVRIVGFGDALPRKLGASALRVSGFSEFRGFVTGLAGPKKHHLTRAAET